MAAVLSTSELEYVPAQVNVPVEIRFSFVPQVFLPIGSIITLILPGFEGTSSETIIIFSFPEGVITAGSWNATNCRLSVRSDKLSSVGSPISFVVRSVYGISVPSIGLLANQQSLLVEAAVGQLYIPPFPILSSPAVNSSRRERLSDYMGDSIFAKQPIITFSGSAGYSVSLTLNVSFRTRLAATDVLILYLPGFSGEVSTRSPVDFTTYFTPSFA